jgi:pyruvate-formate lyase-activating enzyme
MHLAELVGLRTRPGAGLLLALTQRCPLRCAHCTTSSTLDAPQLDDRPFRVLVDSFRDQDRPDVVFMSGGEPLLRPELVAALATRARRSGTRSALLSGMFFARTGTVPEPVRRAVATLDHFSASLDVYHEAEVSRERVFAALAVIADLVPGVSLHLTGLGDSDPYLTDLLAEVRRRFGDRVPVLVSLVRPAGRAATWVAVPAESTEPDPCEFAAWPLVDYDGQVFACCQQTLVRATRPAHLVLGHAARDPWRVLRTRLETDPVLRSVRAVGPIETARRAGTPVAGGVCATCVSLRGAGPLNPAVAAVAARLLADTGPAALARRWGAGRHADLVTLGWRACPD